MYSFSCVYTAREESLAAQELDKFSAGITLLDCDFENQLTLRQESDGKVADVIVLTLRYLTIGAIFAALVLFFLKKYSMVKSIVNILSLASMSWGCVLLFLFVINLFYGNRLDFFMVFGLACHIVGAGIRFLLPYLARRS